MAPDTGLQRRATAGQPAFPFLDLKAQFASIREEILSAMTRVMDSQRFILGPEVEALEEEVAAYVGSKYAIGCASGSDALSLALMALDVTPGDEVIVPAFTFVATAGSVARLGLKPAFVDIQPETYDLDPAKIEVAMTPRTKAIMPVHLFGLTADMDAISEIGARRGVPVIEDAAQAIGSKYHGKKVGTLGTMACFSFFPSKNLGGGGDGGMITTNDPALAAKLRVLRLHGSHKKYHYDLLGMNSRLDALQAAILRVKLKYLDRWTEERRANAAEYRRLFEAAGLPEIVLPCEPAGRFHTYNQFTIRLSKRDALRAHLQNVGVPTEVYYPAPLHLQPAFSHWSYREGDLPVTETACKQVLSLPIYPEMAHSQKQAVVTAVTDFYHPEGRNQ